MGALVDGGDAPGAAALAGRKARHHLSQCRAERRGEVLRHGRREVMVVVIDHAAVNDRGALGARAEGGCEVEDRQVTLLGNEQVARMPTIAVCGSSGDHTLRHVAAVTSEAGRNVVLAERRVREDQGREGNLVEHAAHGVGVVLRA